MEHWRNDADRGRPKYWEKNLSLCHLVYYKSHMKWPVILLPAKKSLSYVVVVEVYGRAVYLPFWFKEKPRHCFETPFPCTWTHHFATRQFSLADALQLTSAQLLSTRLLMLACFRQSDLFFLFFMFWIWKLCGIVCQLLEYTKIDLPSSQSIYSSLHVDGRTTLYSWYTFTLSVVFPVSIEITESAVFTVWKK
jgi:hypothetical protein